MPQLFMYVHVIQRVPVLMIATLCSYLSGSCTNGIKMLDSFTNLCSNYKNGVLLASQKVFRWTPFVTNNAKVVNLRAMQQWCRKMIRYGWALSSLAGKGSGRLTLSSLFLLSQQVVNCGSISVGVNR